VVGRAIVSSVLTWPSAGNHWLYAPLYGVLPDGIPSSTPGAMPATPNDTNSLTAVAVAWRSVFD